MSDPLELELHAAVSCLVPVLETELLEAISPVQGAVKCLCDFQSVSLLFRCQCSVALLWEVSALHSILHFPLCQSSLESSLCALAQQGPFSGKNVALHVVRSQMRGVSVTRDSAKMSKAVFCPSRKAS